MKDLAERLTVDVPKKIDELKAQGGPNEADQQRARLAWEKITKDGKPLMFGGDDVKAEELYVELVYGLAVTAFNRGGVKFFGLNWEAVK